MSNNFEAFALDHKRHNHCQACGGCIIARMPLNNPADPANDLIQDFPVWCVPCRDRLKARAERTGAALPWKGGYEFTS